MIAALISVALPACDDGDVFAPSVPQYHELAVLEVTFRNIGRPSMTATATIHPDTALVFETLSVGFLDHTAAANRTRYVHALFRVRNAFHSLNQTTSLRVTLVAVGTASTFPGTPFRILVNENGASASDSFAQQVHASGRPRLTADGGIAVDSAGVLRILSPAEIPSAKTPGVSNVFNFGYIVSRGNESGSVDGTATVAFALPLLDVGAENPATLSVILLALLETVD